MACTVQLTASIKKEIAINLLHVPTEFPFEERPTNSVVFYDFSKFRRRVFILTKWGVGEGNLTPHLKKQEA